MRQQPQAGAATHFPRDTNPLLVIRLAAHEPPSRNRQGELLPRDHAHCKEVADLERRAPDIMKNPDATVKRIEDLRAEHQRLTGDFGILQAIAPTRDEEERAKRASVLPVCFGYNAATSSRTIGSLTMNSVPTFSSLCTSIVPRCASTMP